MADDLVKSLGFDELERKLENIYEKLSAIIGLLDSRKGAKITMVDANASQEVRSLVKEILELKKQNEALILQQKQQSIERKKGTQETIGYLNELKEKVKQLTLEYMRLSEAEYKNAKNNVIGTQGKATLDALKAHRGELALAEMAYGNYSKQVGHYSMATKMLGINVGQVMKEMPNFAISMRTGIMSLTNNLPMLAEALKQVRLEQIAMKAEGKAVPSMFSLISKSIFGLTGIMSIGMVLLQLYGADIIKWIGTLFKGKDAVDQMTTSQKALNKVFSEGTGKAQSTIAEVMRLGIEINKFGGDAKYADDIIKDFNKTFDTQYTTISELKKAYPELAKTMVEEAIRMQAALAEIDNASKQYMRKRAAEQELSLFNPKDVSAITNQVDIFMDKVKKYGGDASKYFEQIKKQSFGVVTEGNIILRGAGGVLESWFKSIPNGEKIASLYYNIKGATVALEAYKKSATELLPYEEETLKEDGAKNGSGDREPKKIFVAEEYYAKERERLYKEIAATQLATEKTTTDGVEQEFSSRYAAMRKLLELQTELAEIERDEAKENTRLKFNEKRKEILNAISTNNKLLSIETNPTKRQEILDAQQINNKSLENLQENFYNDMLKADDDYTKKTLDQRRRVIDETVKILKEEQKELFAIIEDNTKQNLIELEKQNENKKASEKEKLNSSIGFLLDLQNASMGYEMRMLELSLKNEQEKQNILKSEIQAKISANEAIMNNETEVAEKRIAAEIEVRKYKEQLNNQELKEAEELAKKRLAIEEYIANKTVEYKKDAIKTGQDAILETIKSFYQKYYELLDNERDYFKDVEKNKEKDIENRLDAGIISEQEASDEKNRLKVWEESNQKAINEREKKAKKEQFLLDQAIALAKVAMNTAIGITNANTIPGGQVMIPFIIASGIAQAALITAQSIPYFEKGGIADKNTWAVVGEKRHEVIESDRGLMITPNVPTLTSLRKGDKVYPSIEDYVSKLNIIKSDKRELSQLQERQLINMLYKSDKSLLNETKGLRKDIRSLKLQNNVKVINDYSTSLKYANKKKGLLG